MVEKIDYEMIGKALWFPAEKILVIADLHIGYEDMLSSVGVFIPKHQFQQTLDELARVVDRIGKVKEIVICGDLKHEFGKISNQEWKETLKILDFLQERGKVVLVRGNHDSILEPIARRRGLKIVESYVVKGILFAHGDKKVNISDKKIKMIVLGHKHPAITVSDNYKSEKYKCFLVGKWQGKLVVILPSFFPLVEGSDVSLEDTNLGFELNLKEFDVYVPVSGEENVLKFGKLKKFI
ncbi:MAG: metallophosphoesterase [Nanoarchaeota archaeon]|nr:metallophosphoesterase [Nanoarchaeota archaeon]